MYGMESEEYCNLERSALEQKDEMNAFSNQNKTSAPEAGNNVACFEFQKNGACLQRNCKYIHFNRTTAYPNVGSIRGESSKTSPRPRPMPRIEIPRDRINNQICYSFRYKGYFRFGSKCRFSHQVSVPPYSKNDSYHDPNVNHNVNVNNFLEDMKNVLNTLKGIVEMQHQPTSFPFTNVRGYQHQQVYPSNKPGTTCVASCSDGLENKPIRNSLRTKKGKRKVRRGLRKRKGDGSEKSSGTCNFYCANVNGFKSKADSINQIILGHNIDVVLLCETKVNSNSAIGMRGFQSFPSVRQKNCGGGLYIGIRHGLCESVMTDSGRNADFITVRLNCWDRCLRVILVYGTLGV